MFSSDRPLGEVEDGDFRAHVETDLVEVAKGAVYVEAAVPCELEKACGVALVDHGKKGGREERRLALAAVGMSGKNPAMEGAPALPIDRIGIVAERDGRGGGIVIVEGLERIEFFRPEVIHADYFETGDFEGFVAENGDALQRER